MARARYGVVVLASTIVLVGAAVVAYARLADRPRRPLSQLVGEATVLGESAAIATVSLTEASRFWCAQGKSLNAYLAANPDARHALEHSFNVSLREKLDAMNRAAAPPTSA